VRRQSEAATALWILRGGLRQANPKRSRATLASALQNEFFSSLLGGNPQLLFSNRPRGEASGLKSKKKRQLLRYFFLNSFQVSIIRVICALIP
jgi:hypothetical protein